MKIDVESKPPRQLQTTDGGTICENPADFDPSVLPVDDDETLSCEMINADYPLTYQFQSWNDLTPDCT